MTAADFTAGVDVYLRYTKAKKEELMRERTRKYPDGRAMNVLFIETSWLGDVWNGETFTIPARYLLHKDTLANAVEGMTPETVASLCNSIDNHDPETEVLFCFLTNINNRGVIIVDKL